MPTDYLPQYVDPFRFADNATSLQGVLLVKSMERLRTSLANDEGEVKVSLVFGRDEQKIRFIKGHLEAHLTLQCQRCMGSFVYQMTSYFRSAIVVSDKEGEFLPDGYEPILVKDGSLIILDMVEDELILSLPIVPLHDVKVCPVKLPIVASSTTEAEVRKESPFKVIESLKVKESE